jgi:large subunit ribosomal protein L25
MSDQFEINAEARDDMGKGASRRLRRLANQIPAIIYGAGQDAKALTLVSKDLEKALENEAFYSHVITINIGDSQEKAILKDLQRHPAKNRVMHADFLRIDEKVAIKVHVPIHFINEDISIGVKTEGGIVQHQVTDIEVQCLPANIPAFIEVDMADVEIGRILHLSDVALPEGVTSVALALGDDHDLAIASINAPRTASDEGAAATDVEGGEETSGDAEGGDSEE